MTEAVYLDSQGLALSATYTSGASSTLGTLPGSRSMAIGFRDDVFVSDEAATAIHDVLNGPPSARRVTQAVEVGDDTIFSRRS